MPYKKKTDILEVFGSNMRSKRNELGLSQRKFGAKAGIDNADVSHMENAEVNVTLKTLQSIAEALEINAFELLIKA